MKLIFKKTDNAIEVKMKDLEEEDFDYIKMIKRLIENNKFEDSEFEGEFTDAEKLSVANMLEGINNAIIEDNSDEIDEEICETPAFSNQETSESEEIEDLPF
jgi:hypothetical protein